MTYQKITLTLTMLITSMHSSLAIELISVREDGLGGAQIPFPLGGEPDYSTAGRFSSNARFVVFSSPSLKLTTPPDASSGETWESNVYLRDRQTLETFLISKPNADVGDDMPTVGANSESPSISDDARYISFESSANNLIADYHNEYTGPQRQDIYYYDRNTQKITLISQSINGQSNDNASSSRPAISGNGRYITYESSRSDITTDNTNGQSQIYLYNLATKSTTLISRANGINGAVGNSNSVFSSISRDGRYVVFKSVANNLTSESDNNNKYDLFLRDTVNHTTTLISKKIGTDHEFTSDGGTDDPQGNLYTEESDNAISDDGRYIVYHSRSKELVENDAQDSINDVFLYDRRNDTTIKITGEGVDGNTGNNDSNSVYISDNGRYIAFRSRANNLVANDTNVISGFVSSYDIFLYDQKQKEITLVNLDENGQQADNGSVSSLPTSINNNGSVLFSSNAPSLLPSAYSDRSVGGLDLYASDLIQSTNESPVKTVPSNHWIMLITLSLCLSLLIFSKKRFIN